ncbi:MAG: hypothetical protein A3G34_03015 [Candidatus Lindowbacteria bacterium RIFCSPLOWO2_12_FULL_62_27]|nr:MAG: hypothetical protein A3G34_03015 [Candidatus Lindowbacteria bacterium RIFCSPLOWO2_12_FULL_62_27]OGH61994.1 MAG: hypothetical protein A3I06_14350 [Candidatus Lindowbacteria bacterium RIFCSPLOWO2_02_FULL_62_12]
MRILRKCLDRMIELARRDAPNETCGLMTGPPGLVRVVHPIKNVSPEPRIRYEFHSNQHVYILGCLEREGIPVLGVYHSHPESQPFPSPTDVARAVLTDGTPLWPDYRYVILSLETPERPQARAFRILQGGEIEEEELKIEDNAP